MKYSLIDRMKLVSMILIKHDPMSLISASAPADEYESEAVRIVQGIATDWRIDSPSIENVEAWCQDVFEDQFSPDLIKHINWKPIVDEIFKVFQSITNP